MRSAFWLVGLAVLAGAAPASLARAPRILGNCDSAASGTGAGERQAQGPVSNTGVFLAVPVGKVCVGPNAVEGEPAYVRRTTGKEGMAMVEVSATPFMPELPASGAPAGAILRPDQPAGW